MTGERAERFVVLNLRLMAIGFAVTGFFFIAWPDGTLARLTELGGHLGFDTPAPKTEERLWLSLGFAYMVVITAIALIVQTDVVRYRPLLLALAVGKAASSITSLIFFIEDDVFVYLLNGIVDGSLVFASLLLALAAGKAASSITSLIFFIQDDVFVYLLNGIVDGSLVFASLLLWSLAGRVGSPAAPP